MLLFSRQLALLGKRLLLILGLFFCGRLFFFIYNIQHFAPAWPEDVLKSFFYGLQFDISAIIYFNLPLILLHFVPPGSFSGRINERIIKYYFITVNSLLVLSNFLDSEYFRFTGKRTGSDIFSYMGINNDILKLVPRFIYDYWYILLIWALIMSAAWRIYPLASFACRQKRYLSPKRIVIHSLAALLAIAFMLSLARGYRLKPLRVITATNYVSARNIPLILNTPFTILKSFNKQHLVVPDYFPEGNASSGYSPVRTAVGNGKNRKVNVVVIIMESFSKEFSGYLTGSKGYMPFTDSLMQHSMVFPNAFSNSRTSIEALPSILASIPSLMETPFVSSPYAANTINSLPGQLGLQGYHTSFFHGGRNGTMGFDDFTRLAGVNNYFGKDEFEDDNYYDGYWGIYDEEFFQFFEDKINTFPKPFFSCFFSLSSHHPYLLPEKHRDRFPEGDHLIHKTIAYADYSLRMFFKAAKKEPWFKNTLFVITADHTAQSDDPFYQNGIGGYAVPIIYYHPGNPKLTGKNPRLTQHIDIMPSVLDYVNYSGHFISFGNSVFSGTDKGFAVNYLNRLYQYKEGDWIYFHDGEQERGLYNYREDSLLVNNYAKNYDGIPENIDITYLEERLKGIIQQYNHKMVNNMLITN